MVNSTSKVLQFISAGLLIVALIVGTQQGITPKLDGGGNEFIWSITLTWWLLGVLLCAALYGLGEVIELLAQLVKKSDSPTQNKFQQ